MKINTVGDLREALKSCDDSESLIFDLKEVTEFGETTHCLDCVGVGSSGGGRIAVIWLDKKGKQWCPSI